VSDDDTLCRIRRLIGATPSLRLEVDGLSEDDDLYDAGLKSLAAVHLMVALEEEFGIEFPDSVLHRSAFATMGRIRDTIVGLRTIDQRPAESVGRLRS
jgi:D-alanine--poly(phosphoribitol) ligase subunit 2